MEETVAALSVGWDVDFKAKDNPSYLFQCGRHSCEASLLTSKEGVNDIRKN